MSYVGLLGHDTPILQLHACDPRLYIAKQVIISMKYDKQTEQRVRDITVHATHRVNVTIRH